MADSLTPAQINDELRNLHADGRLPFVHSPIIYRSERDSGVVWTDARIAEF